MTRPHAAHALRGNACLFPLKSTPMAPGARGAPWALRRRTEGRWSRGRPIRSALVERLAHPASQLARGERLGEHVAGVLGGVTGLADAVGVA